MLSTSEQKYDAKGTSLYDHLDVFDSLSLGYFTQGK